MGVETMRDGVLMTPPSAILYYTPDKGLGIVDPRPTWGKSCLLLTTNGLVTYG